MTTPPRYVDKLDDGTISSPYYAAITASDTANFTFSCRAIYVGGTGDVAAVREDGTAVLFSNVPAGTTLHIRAIRVNSTNTTASNMVALG